MVSGSDSKQLCLSLIKCETEEEVVKLLDDAGLWKNDALWRYYGDTDSNWSTGGNQQARADAALMEKIVNSADALLMGAALERGIDPQGSGAPTSVREAVAAFFDSESQSATRSGDIRTWPKAKRTALAKEISVFTTGQQGGALSFNVCDSGEGQTPLAVPDTILSLARGNKIRIPFVQGKFNQGGTGALRFCDLQVVVTRRNQALVEPGDDIGKLWSFTIVRREPPKDGLRNSTFTYLAPIGHELAPRGGDILRFEADSMALFPEENAPYSRETAHGTLVKLIGYQAKGFAGQAMLTGGLLPQINLMLPSLALPIRVHECRTGYKGEKARSFHTTAAGLIVRLDEDMAGNLEPGFPAASMVTVDGERLELSIYAFKPNTAKTYRSAKDALLYTLEGQTHARNGTQFFRTRKVNMGQLANSLLVIVNCTELSNASIESLFMTSRDRLSDGELRRKVEDEIRRTLKQHDGLKQLRESRKRQEIEERLGESKPLEKVLDDVLKHSPDIAKLFLGGERLNSPFRKKSVGTDDVAFEGKLHPTYFRHLGKTEGEELVRNVHVNDRTRVKFETDVVNDYFVRPLDPGQYSVYIAGADGWLKFDEPGHAMNTFNGIATLSLALPETAASGDSIRFRVDVKDPANQTSFENFLTVHVLEPVDRTPRKPGNRTKPPGPDSGSDREVPHGIAIPQWVWVKEEEWGNHEPAFTDQTAMKVDRSEEGEPGNLRDSYTFYVNASNVHLLRELKSAKDAEAEIVKARFATGCGLVALGMLHESGKLNREADDDGPKIEDANVESLVRQVTTSVAPLIVPMIEALGSLDESFEALAADDFADD